MPARPIDAAKNLNGFMGSHLLYKNFCGEPQFAFAGMLSGPAILKRIFQIAVRFGAHQ
jgi:hypothetical protein